MSPNEIYFNYKQLNGITLIECKNLKDWLLERIDVLEKKELIEIPVEKLHLSTRTIKALLKAKLFTVKEIHDFGVDCLHIFQNMGAKTIEEIEKTITGLLDKSQDA